MTAVGEVKIPGGKLVRVEIGPAAGPRACRIGGDFFTDGDAGPLLERAGRTLADRLALLDRAADARAIETWYHDAVRALEPTVAHALIGANAESMTLAALRAYARIAPAAFAEALARFEERRDARIARQWRAAQSGTAPAAPLIDMDEARARWRALAPTIVVDVPRMPEEQMRVEREWSAQVARGERAATLRIWDWAAPAVICGRYQSIEDEVNLEEALARGVHVVRRDSGGGAMFVEPAHTITYSLYAPLGFVRGLSLAQSFQLCDAWLIEALRDCGIDARFAGLNDIAGPDGKIGGAAEQRVAGAVGCVLHHDTLAYDMDARALGRLLNVSAEKMSDKAVKSAAKRVDPMRAHTTLTRARIVERMVRAARSFGGAGERGDATVG